MDYLLYQDRLETDGYLLGEVNWGKLILCGNGRPLCVTLNGTDGGRVLQGGKKGSLPLLQQQKCTWNLLSPQMLLKTQYQVRRYMPKPPRYQTVLYWELQIHPDIWPHESISWVGTTKCDTLTKRAITTATLHSYHSRHSQLLPDVVLILWGNKVTVDISFPLRCHASKEVPRQHLGTSRKDKWSNDKCNAVDWEHLDLALKNKTGMYKIWRSKQNLEFCGTRVQVGCFSSNSCPDEQCPNCGRRETAMHLMLCPDKDCAELLTETVDKLTKWMAQDNITYPEIFLGVQICPNEGRQAALWNGSHVTPIQGLCRKPRLDTW